MREEEKLRPCPFCGGEAKHRVVDDDSARKVRAAINCLDCRARTRNFLTVEEASIAWNLRTEEHGTE